jgi:hypothetical protein
LDYYTTVLHDEVLLNMPVSPIAELIIQQDTVVLAVFLGGSKMEKKMPDQERIDDARSYRIVSTPTNKGEAVIAAVIVERAVKAGWVPESVLYDDSIGHDVIADMIEGVFCMKVKYAVALDEKEQTTLETKVKSLRGLGVEPPTDGEDLKSFNRDSSKTLKDINRLVWNVKFQAAFDQGRLSAQMNNEVL